jgi:hypothetical protein
MPVARGVLRRRAARGGRRRALVGAAARERRAHHPQGKEPRIFHVHSKKRCAVIHRQESLHSDRIMPLLYEYAPPCRLYVRHTFSAKFLPIGAPRACLVSSIPLRGNSARLHGFDVRQHGFSNCFHAFCSPDDLEATQYVERPLKQSPPQFIVWSHATATAPYAAPA